MSNQDLQTQPSAHKAAKPYKGIAMEGVIARWYTAIRQGDTELEQVIRQVSDSRPAGGRVLEGAPGPGYLAIELAKLGAYQVVGLDISASFVEIARAKAKQASVAAEFNQGNASRMPFGDGTFDFIVCRAAFKNFTEPVQAIQEMHRVLKLGSTALIIDLRGDASPEDIRSAVRNMGLSAVNRFMTQAAFKHFLLKNAYTGAQIRQMVAQTSFAGCVIREQAIGMEIWLEK
ncbi:MAG: class I SAM-dependent methyltransferase [Roseiflexaceae bacterium]